MFQNQFFKVLRLQEASVLYFFKSAGKTFHHQIMARKMIQMKSLTIFTIFLFVTENFEREKLEIYE